MPNPVAAPPAAQRAVPADLDELVRNAMRGGGVEKLKSALLTAPVEVAPEPETPSLPLPEVLDALAHAAADVRTAEDPAAALDEVSRLLAEARRLLPPPPEAPPPPAPIPLPAIRIPYLLAVTPGHSPESLAEALDIDVATARNLVQAGGTRVAVRGADREELEGRESRARSAGLHATVQARSDLQELPPAEALLGFDREARAVLWPDALWLDPPDAANRPPGLAETLDGVFLVVPGEVEVRHQRGAREPEKWARQRYTVAGPTAEQRVIVVDLHLPGRILRAVEGVVDLREYDATAARRAMKGWIETLPERWPRARIEARRVCAGGATSAGEDGRLSGSGWPAWEEHSRVCRLHHGAS